MFVSYLVHFLVKITRYKSHNSPVIGQKVNSILATTFSFTDTTLVHMTHNLLFVPLSYWLTYVCLPLDKRVCLQLQSEVLELKKKVYNLNKILEKLSDRWQLPSHD